MRTSKKVILGTITGVSVIAVVAGIVKRIKKRNREIQNYDELNTFFCKENKEKGSVVKDLK